MREVRDRAEAKDRHGCRAVRHCQQGPEPNGACSVTPDSLGGTIVSVSRDEVLITATALAQRLDADEPLTILDVRWQLAEPDGRAAYERGHLPGAVYVSLEDELSDHNVPGRGRHPLPSGRSVEAAARRWGVRQGVPVVVYDDWNRAGSARAWWVLTAAGIPDVRILDGGLGAWTGVLETGSVVPAPGDVTVAHDDLYAGALPTLTAEQAAVAATLLDARAPERFRGEVEPVDPVAGHIPGARNVPSTGLLDRGRNLFARRRSHPGVRRHRTDWRLLRIGRHRIGGACRTGCGRRRRRAVSGLVVRMVFGFNASGGTWSGIVRHVRR